VRQPTIELIELRNGHVEWFVYRKGKQVAEGQSINRVTAFNEIEIAIQQLEK